MKNKKLPQREGFFLSSGISFFLIAIAIFALSAQGNAQAIHFCGELPANTATSTNPDSIFFDRFGNSYDKIEFEDPYYRAAFTEAEYFHLHYTQHITENMRKVIHKVFLDLAGIIPQRVLQLSCDETTIYPKKVIIQV